MGYGDEIMASGAARGAAARGKRVAFGDGNRIRWHRHAHEIFRGNPNVAPPGSEGADDLEWVENYAGRRPYCRQDGSQRWLFTPGTTRGPGEMFFSDDELRFAEKYGEGFAVIEPNVPAFKSVKHNKQWPVERYDEIAHRFEKMGLSVVQFWYPPPYGPGHRIMSARKVACPTFRHALAVLARAEIFVGPEGGLHHGAAAVGVPAAVIFGGFISPAITGYASHANLYVGGEPCGSLHRCEHCRLAMQSIGVGQVYEAIKSQLAEREKVSDPASRNESGGSRSRPEEPHLVAAHILG